MQVTDMTREQLLAHIASLHATVERKLSLKVSAKGALSLYGMGKWPVTLYAGQWERLLAHSDEITAFIAANAGTLTRKA